MARKGIRLINTDKIGASQLSLLLVMIIYALIIIISVDSCYFWDNVQFTSKEAHWYYDNNFSSFLLPGISEDSEIIGSGCHPPLIGIMTAILWKIFGKHLWVSHMFIAFWAMILAFGTWRLLRSVVPENIAGFLLPVLLLDSSILSQMYIASPDFILLTSFVIALLAVIERRKWLLTFALIFLVLINGRGAMTGGIFLIFYIIHQVAAENKRMTAILFFKSFLPFLPAFIMAGFYYISYIIKYGWIFNNPDSPWLSGWQKPEGVLQILKNLAAFCLRLGENGRFFIYLSGIFLLVHLYRRKKLKKAFIGLNLSFGLMFLLLFLFFLYFVVTTTAAMTTRYYLGMFFVFNILIFKLITDELSSRGIKIILVVALAFLITGNLWMYPDRISKAWDATLAHLPYYELREECFDYLEKNNYDLTKVSGGFCFKGNQRYKDLKEKDLFISERTDNKFFIYSNISNLDDSFINELTGSGKWNEIKTFKKGFVFVSIYENRYYVNSE